MIVRIVGFDIVLKWSRWFQRKGKYGHQEFFVCGQLGQWGQRAIEIKLWLLWEYIIC